MSEERWAFIGTRHEHFQKFLRLSTLYLIIRYFRCIFVNVSVNPSECCSQLEKRLILGSVEIGLHLGKILFR